MKLKTVAMFGLNTSTLVLSFIAKGMDNNFAALDSWAFTQDDPTAKIAAPTSVASAPVAKPVATTATPNKNTVQATVQQKTTTKKNTVSAPMAEEYYVPRVYLNGYAGANDSGDYNAIGRFDILAPVYLRTDRNLYLYGQANIASAQDSLQGTSYSGSLGFGYRQIINADNGDTTSSGRIMGAYLLVDGNHTPDGHNFTDISPGIETLGERWDFRANGYIPVGSKSWDTAYWAHDLGDWSNYDQDTTPHTITDTQYIYHEEIGTGADAELGVKLFSINRMPVKAYLDGYYFYMNDHDNMLGAGARLTFQPTPYLTLEARYTYDNYQMNQFLAGIRVNLNELNNYQHTGVDDANMQMRLFDQLERNFATQITGTTSPEVGGPTDGGIGTPDDQNDDLVVSDNNWYFADPSTMPEGYSNGDGTHANPYSADEFNQTTVDQIYGDTVSSGQYSSMNIHLESGNAYVISSSNSGDPVMNLPANTYVYGQDDNFEQNEQVTIEGGMILSNGDNLNYLQFYNDSYYQLDSALTVNTGANVILNNITIGSADNNVSNSYATGIVMDEANVTINNSNIYAYDKDSTTNTEGVVEATGVKMTNGGKLVINNTDIAAKAVESNASISNSGIAYGIHSDGSYDNKGSGTIIYVQEGSNVSAGGEGGSDDSGNGYGILVGANNKAIDATNADTDAHPIAHNQIFVTDGSKIIGAGKAGGTDSGNGFGVVVGYGDLTITDQSNLDLSLNDNHVTISGKDTTITGQGDGSKYYSGNGYGVVIGYGNAFVVADQVVANNNDLYIKNSYLTISDGSTVSGVGQMNSMNTYQAYAGRGIGVLIGFGHAGWNHYYASAPQGNDFQIGGSGDNTQVIITNSTLNSTSENLGNYQSTGNGETALASANIGYGLLIGYGGAFDGNANGDTNSLYGVKNIDNVTLTNDYFNASVLGVGGTSDTRTYGYGMVAAVGVEVGNYSSSSAHCDNSNQVTLKDDHFTTYTEGYPSQASKTQYSVGFYMPSGSGVINFDNSNGNTTFYRYGYLGTSVNDNYGYGLLGPVRPTNITSWTPKASLSSYLDLSIGLWQNWYIFQ